MRYSSLLRLAGIAAFYVVTTGTISAQTITTGEVVGTVTDQTGAAVPDVKVTLKSADKGTESDARTSSTGAYHFYLISPGRYSILVSATNFQAVSRTVEVALGTVTTVDVQLSIGKTSETIEVTAEAPLMQTDSPNVGASITAQQVGELPNPGNDLSYIAQTAPGSVMNTQAGYGNFSSFGMPGTSNLFTLNGMDDNDPFLNLNNSGATNLLLGQNEVAEVSVVNIGYGGQYGGLAGANINYVTRSGTNGYHGQATYFWNGSRMNANDWFNNQSGTKKPFSNANQWGAWFGGPLKKDKLFFFLNTEGLRVVIPTNTLVLIPSPQFETATIANLTAQGLTASIPFYQNTFSLYNTAPGAANATPGNGNGDPLGCNGFTGLPAGVPCALNFRSTAGNFTHEWIFSSRVDYNISNHDQFFVRYQMDRGVQATYTDPINPAFNATSIQPEYQGQMSETHAFAGGATNQFILSGAWYTALFGPPNLAAALAKFPTSLQFGDGTFTTMGGDLFIWPQGRNVTQYQISDDYSKTFGRHSLKTGMKFRRNDISDHDYGFFTSGLLIPFSVTDFYNGGSSGDVLLQNFPTSLDQPIAIYSVGGYVQDDWKVRPRFTLTLSLRADHPSNPVCNKNCFARLTGSFSSINHDPTIPYSQVVLTNQNQALSGLDSVLWQPRVGFAWQPLGSRKNETVIRGGIGLFYDAFPGQVADNFSSNPPFLNAFTTAFDNLSPSETTNLFTDASQSNQAFLNGFKNGQTLAQIQAAAPAFVPPNLTVSDAKSRAPQYQKWSLELQQGFGTGTSLTVSYIGNHGIHEVVVNNGVNAFSSSFTGLPTTQADQRFGTVTLVQSAGVSNYNGVTASFQHRFSRFGSGLLQFNYTYGHALDIVSNAGFNPFTAGSSQNPTNPFNIRTSYGNADYDVRQSANMNYVWEVPIRSMLFGHGWASVVEGWQLSGTLFARTGLPYTVFDSNATNLISGNNYGGSVYASYLGSAKPACGNPNNTCLKTSMFAPSGQNDFGAQERNNFRGPQYFDTDFTVMKYTKLHTESAKLGIGLQFFNILNHPNFNLPDHNLADSTFGKISSTVGSPTSILGSFLGGDASPRIIQLKAQLTF
ncbi:MAG TPA: carboxypeptidase regulatory-like domain-containing protein [Candidatus Acidoferrum sp.]|nr:carboxypeptidase regulatory-like domain-containing protein [Candidatus Acidoferrum sp.]